MRSARLLFLALAALALAGCSTLAQHAAAKVAGARAAHYALDMEGVPYRYGGNSPRHGFDCSGLVQYSYARAGARVPRTTRQLRRASRPVSLSGLRPGDLLFFNQQGKRSSHVALYLGGGRFVHAPSSGKTVSVATLSNPYWRRHLESARRPRLQ